ncbi:AMP-dependent synthetase/ligase [Arthrobacter sp. Helios]|uniref:AMP-dependent synthetase/ligase n=1 Tax=Arthrobacter sp. Helios TaxID=2828862 RepID=UPI0020709F0E|nr:AMP-dependent synthetase/ligase [Arthrobacter sp. Helios]UPO77596.1 AMP-dependent synthetase/ligase [Arthrobacter sp. Helios]
MRESSTDLFVELPADSNITDILLGLTARSPDLPLYARQSEAGWEDITAAGFLAAVSAAAKGLIQQGIRPGDCVAVMSSTRYEWTVVDLAIWFAGAVTVPIYETSSASQIQWILEDSAARLVFAEDAAKAKVIAAGAGAAGLDVPLWHLTDVDGGTDLRALAASGAEVSDADLEAARSVRGLADTASLVYTSGTTGRPKGCEITHGNFAVFGVNVIELLPEMLKAPNARTLMFLPLAHVLARAVQIGCLAAGVQLGHCASTSALVGDMKTFRPTFLLAVPRIFEKIYTGAQESAEAAGKGRLFASAASTAVAFSEAVDRAGRGGKGPSLPLRLRHRIFDALLYPKVRNVFGGQLSIAISGASPLSPQLCHFFRGAGIAVLEGYGLTETTAPASVNTVPLTRVGTVGLPMPGNAVRIAADGEVLVKGVGVFNGYHRNPAANAEAFTDGWFHTGDVGTLDDDGFLTITGRKKDLLVTAGGKNVAPGPLEEKIREHRLVSQVVVVGEGRPFVGALVTLDEEALAVWAREQGHSFQDVSAVNHPVVQAQVQEAVDAANSTVSRAEQIRRFTVLPRDFSLEAGHVTPTLKLRRQAVMADFSAEVEKLYVK